MDLKEISLAQLLDSACGTDYFSTFAKLIGRGEDCLFYEGISDEDYYLIEEIEEVLEHTLPIDYVEFLGFLNGGHFLEIDFFSLVEKNFPNSIYNRNFINTIRRELKIEDSALIIGKYSNYVIYVDCLDNDGSYTLMDIRNNEKIEFESLSALVGFIFYVLAINSSKKIEAEKEQIKEMKEKLHGEFVSKNKEWKKEREKKLSKLRAKSAASALKAKQKKHVK